MREVKFAVVGCGAVGSYYGAKLCRAGAYGHFLLRSDYDVVSRQGVFIRSPEGDFNLRPRYAKAPEEIGVSDLVLVAMANDQFPTLLPPLVGPRTAILTLQNGLGNEEQLARLFPPEQILGGLCFVCLNRTAPGHIHHIDHGRIVIGEFQRRSEPRTHNIASLFRQAGVPCEVTDNLAQAHWEKLIWNIPFNGLGVGSAAGFDAILNGHLPPGLELGPCLTTDKLLVDQRWEKLVHDLMQEVIHAARVLGYDLSDALAEEQIVRTRTMGAYKASTVLDYERGQPLEMESLFLEPLREAREAGLAMPRLEALCKVLQQMNPVEPN